MIDLKPLTSEFTPKSALIAYENGSESYLEVHEIKGGKIGAGKPLSIESAKKIKELFEDIDDKVYQSLSGIIPKNLLYANTDKNEPILIWHSKPKEVKMHFAKSTKIKSGYGWVPALLWVFKGGSISIYAIKSTSLKSKVFHAPFFNVYLDGSICMGNVEIQKQFTSFDVVMRTVENYFFNSEFTLHGDNEGPGATPGAQAGVVLLRNVG